MQVLGFLISVVPKMFLKTVAIDQAHIINVT